jgi:hypothetical protein
VSQIDKRRQGVEATLGLRKQRALGEGRLGDMPFSAQRAAFSLLDGNGLEGECSGEGEQEYRHQQDAGRTLAGPRQNHWDKNLAFEVRSRNNFWRRLRAS